MSKKTKSTIHPKSRKTVRPKEVLDYKDQHFNWCINTLYLYYEGNYFNSYEKKHCVLDSTEDNLLKIIKKLDSYRSWTWRKIERRDNNTSCGIMSIEKLDVIEMVTNHLTNVGLMDHEELYKIEINNHHRVWGIRQSDCLFLIWNDPDHSFYKHKKKNYAV